MDSLQRELDRAVEWVKYAEAKNGLLVVANGAAIVGVVQSAGNISDLHIIWGIYLFNLVILAGCALLVGLTSFLPTLDFATVLPKAAKKPSDNILYFGTIARYSPEYFLEQFDKATGVSTGHSSIDAAYAHQIVVNSRIAVWKFERFSLSAWISMAAYVTPFVVPFVYWVNKHTRVEEHAG